VKAEESERNEIVVMLSKNKSAREIAKKLLRSAGSISREIKRDSGRIRYRANKAQERAEERQEKRHRKFVLKSYALREEAGKLISNRCLPELVLGRLKETSDLPRISAESI
jgi:IS30 family transposase